MLKKLLVVAAIMTFCMIAASAQKTHKHKTQRVTVTLSEPDGYKPESFTLRRGELAKITFIRRNEGCGNILAMPDFGVRRNLPINTPVVVTLRPKRTGTFTFACGMNMYKGQIIVS